MLFSEQYRVDILSFPFIGEEIQSTIYQTLFYGIYLVLVPTLVYVMLANGLQSRARKWLLASIIFMFALSTVFWAFAITYAFRLIGMLQDGTIGGCVSDDPYCLYLQLGVGPWLQIFGSILFVNYLIADGIIVWRAWVLCPDQRRIVLMVPAVMLAINTVVFLMTVALRAIRLKSLEQGLPYVPLVETPLDPLDHIITGVHLAYLTLSLLINIFATSIIGLKAWRYRKLLMESGIGVRNPSQAFRILAILAESGVIYILIGVVVLASNAIPVALQKEIALSDVITTVAMQLVGIYQVVVLLLVEKNRSLDSTFYPVGTRVRPPQTDTLNFAPGPVLASGEQINPDTLEITLDLIEASPRMGGGNIKVPSEEHSVL